MVWMLFLTGFHWITALGVVLVCMASPSHFYPLQSVAISGLLAMLVGLFSARILRRPALTVSLPTLIILGGAFVGLYSVNQELRGNMITMLGNLQSLSGGEIFLRFIIAFLLIELLAVFSTSPFVTRALSVFSLAGPGILLIYPARSMFASFWPGAEEWLLQGVTLVCFVVVLIVWGRFNRKLTPVETLQEHLGRGIITNVLGLDDGQKIQAALDLIDGWIDPKGQLIEPLEKLLEARAAHARKAALTNALRTLDGPYQLLPRSYRDKLMEVSGDKPEALLVLAKDDLSRKNFTSAVIELKSAADKVLENPQLVWIAYGMINVVKLGTEIPSDLETTLFLGQIVEVVGDFANERNRPKAVRAAMDKLREFPRPLSATGRDMIKKHARYDTEALVILAEDNMVHQQPAEGFMSLAQVVPETEWLANLAFETWNQYLQTVDLEKVQRTLWDRVQNQSPDSELALAVLSAIAIERGLAPDIISVLVRQ
ncbi:MAG: hypothetical protein FJ010_05140 [Chloroflexi bacterium]|nr:hypothetical protein [Chloroflexota bacterium]